MATDIPMPKLGLTMEEATILQWLVEDGTEVTADQPIVVIETDKTETEVGSPGVGRLHQLGQPGELFPCGQLIGWLLDEGEAPPADPAAVAPRATVAAPPPPAPAAASVPPRTGTPVTPATPGRLPSSPNARRVAAERGVALASVRGTGPGGRIVSEDVEAVADGWVSPLTQATAPAGTLLPPPPGPPSGLVLATAAARSLADLLGVDLAQVPPDPRQGRVTRDDVAAHVRALLQRLAPPLPPPPHTGGPAPAGRSAAMPLLQEPTDTIRLTGMRGTIAQRMSASLHEMAQLTLTMDADLTAVLTNRAERRGAGDDPTPSITDYVVAATARALIRHPRLNAQVTVEGIALLAEVHVGLAVAVDDGLLVPVVRDPAHLDLTDLAAESSRLAEAARSGTLGVADYEGGTFSVSALGALGVDAFTPVINPPNAGILGVGRLRDDPVVVDGELSTVKRLTLSLTWDHRVVDGVPAAEFCRTIVELLADPGQLDATPG